MGTLNLYLPAQTCSISYAVQYQLLGPSDRTLGIMLGHTAAADSPLHPTFHFFSVHILPERGNLPLGHWYLLHPLSATLLSPLDPAWPTASKQFLNLYHPSALNKPTLAFHCFRTHQILDPGTRAFTLRPPVPLDLLSMRRTALLFLTLYSFFDSSPESSWSSSQFYPYKRKITLDSSQDSCLFHSFMCS